MNCNHTFPYWSVVPPSHCPCCGAWLMVRPVSWPMPHWPQPWGPYTVTSTGTSATPHHPNATLAVAS